MSGVRAAQALSEPVAPGDDAVEAMQDMLYEILAEGIDPELSDTPTAAIEVFLHEHARSPKSSREFKEFFHKYGITPAGRRPPLPAPVGELALPPLASRPAPAVQLPPPPKLAPHPAELAMMRSEPPRAGSRSTLPWIVVGVLSLALAAGAWIGLVTVGQLRADLQNAERETRAQGEDLRQLEGRSAGIQSSVAANGELIQRMDQKSDLMLDSLLQPPQPPKNRWQRR